MLRLVLLFTLIFLNLAHAQFNGAGSTITPGQIPGAATNNNASSGNVGEYVQASGSAVSLTSSTAANLTSISLTAGDWDVVGYIETGSNTATIQNIQLSISTTSGTIDTTAGHRVLSGYPSGYTPSLGPSLTTLPVRVSLSTTTTVYLVTLAGFTSGAISGTGFISARRAR